jgi:Short C-terminal domain
MSAWRSRRSSCLLASWPRLGMPSSWQEIAKGEAEAVAAVIRERVERTGRETRQAPLAAQVEAQAPSSGIGAQLRELADLREQGILTPEEFETQKARVLGDAGR